MKANIIVLCGMSLLVSQPVVAQAEKDPYAQYQEYLSLQAKGVAIDKEIDSLVSAQVGLTKQLENQRFIKAQELKVLKSYTKPKNTKRASVSGQRKKR